MKHLSTRWAVAAGGAGVLVGLALGVTGLASAVSPSPSPSVHARPDRPFMDHFGGKLGDKFEHRGGGGGLVSAISGSTLTVRTPDGTKSIGLTSSTAYYTGATKASKSAVSVGSVVRVRLVDPRATKPVAAVVVVMPAHLAGWVTKVDGSTITVTDPSGFTRTITTSGSTTYAKDGAAATASVVSVGTFITAVGHVDADGTTLDATRIATGRPARPNMMGGAPMMGGADMMGDGPIA